MPNLDLESLQRILALEEDTLANPNIAHHLSTGTEDISNSVPMMESLRSPTTRTLMSIRQNQNAHGWISGQFAVAQQEQQGMSEVAEAAEALLKEPLVKSYASTVSTILRETKEAVHGTGTTGRAAQGVPPPARTDDDITEDSSTRSSYPLIATSIQPCGRQAYIHADMDPTAASSSTVDADVQVVSNICFVLPKAETGTVIAQMDEPSALLVAAREKQLRLLADASMTSAAVPPAPEDEKQQRRNKSWIARGGDREMSESDMLRHLDSDIDESFVGNLFLHAKSGVAAQASYSVKDVFSAADFGQDDGITVAAPSSSVAPQKSRMQQLLDEQQAMHSTIAASKLEYNALLDGLAKWQAARREAFDVVTTTAVPYTPGLQH